MVGKQTLLVGVLLGVGLVGGASAFEWEVELGYGVTKGGVLLEDIETTALGASYFFAGVRYDGKPYDLQPFFQKAPYGQILYGSVDLGPVDMKMLDVNAELFMTDPVRGLSFRPHIVRASMEMPGPDPDPVDMWSLDLGYYFLDELKVTLPAFMTGNLDPDVGDTLDSDLSFKEIQIEYVARIDGQHLDLTADYAWDVDNEMTGFGVGGVFYVSRELGVGLMLNSNPDGLSSVFAVASLWASESVGFMLALGRYTEDSGIGEADEVDIVVTARF